MTLADVEAAAAAAPGSAFSVLPVAYAEADPAPWTAFEPTGDSAAAEEAPAEQEVNSPFKVSSNQPAFLQKKQAAKKAVKGAEQVKQEQAKLGVTDEQRSYLVRYRLLTPTGLNNITREVATKMIKRHTIKRRIIKGFSIVFTLLAFGGLCWGTWLTYDYLKINPVTLLNIPEALLQEQVSVSGEPLEDTGEPMTEEYRDAIFASGLDFRFVHAYEEPMPVERTYQFDKYSNAIFKSRDAEPLFFSIKHQESGETFDVVSTMIGLSELEKYTEEGIPESTLREIYVIQNFDELGLKVASEKTPAPAVTPAETSGDETEATTE